MKWDGYRCLALKVFDAVRGDDEFLRCEAWEGLAAVYHLALMTVDGTETVETFASEPAMLDRQRQVRGDLAARGWTGPCGRIQ